MWKPQPPADVGELEPGHLRRSASWAVHAEYPRARQVVEVVTGAAGERTVLPVSRQRADDEARVRLAQSRVPQAEALEHTGPELLEQHVVASRELEQRVTPSLLLQVEAGAALT